MTLWALALVNIRKHQHCEGTNPLACNHIDGSCPEGWAAGWKGPHCKDDNDLPKGLYSI